MPPEALAALAVGCLRQPPFSRERSDVSFPTIRYIYNIVYEPAIRIAEHGLATIMKCPYLSPLPQQSRAEAELPLI